MTLALMILAALCCIRAIWLATQEPSGWPMIPAPMGWMLAAGVFSLAAVIVTGLERGVA